MVTTVQVVIPAWREQDTIPKLITQILRQVPHLPRGTQLTNIYLITHDKATGKAGKQADTQGLVTHALVPRSRGGKIASLNYALKRVSADYVIFMDGDITLSPDALLKLVDRMLTAPKDVGAVAGRPMPLNPTDTMLGFWAKVLTTAVHRMRLNNAKRGKPVNLSGNLFIARRSVLPPKIPRGVSDDAYFTYYIQLKGYKISYEPEAKAYQYFPRTYKDWLLQKTRNQLGEYITAKVIQQQFGAPPKHMRTFLKEVRYFYYTLGVPKNLKQWIWFGLLYLARLNNWGLYAYKRLKLRAANNGSFDMWKNWKKV